MNEVRFIGNVPTPWHSWAIVATPATLSASSPLHSRLQKFLAELSASVHAFDAPAARESSSKAFVEETWEYPREDVEAWLKQVEYPKGDVNEISKAMVESTLRYVLSHSAAVLLSSAAAGSARPVHRLTLLLIPSARMYSTLVAAGVLSEPSGGWNLGDFVDTNVAKLQ